MFTFNTLKCRSASEMLISSKYFGTRVQKQCDIPFTLFYLFMKQNANFQRMFKKFEEKESVSSVQQLKSSVQKGE